MESPRGSSAGSSTGSSKLAGGIRAAARARDREREGRWEGERVSQGELGRSVFTPEGRRGRDRAATRQAARCKWRVRSVHGGHALDTRRPLRRYTEHVAGSKAISVGSRFGPFAGQIWTWAQKQSCSPHNALQFLFKVHCHKGYGLAINCAPK